MTDKQTNVGDVVAWDKVPNGALVRSVANTGMTWWYRRMGESGDVAGIRRADGAGTFWSTGEKSEHDRAMWKGWSPDDWRVTVIALGLTGQETAAELQRLAEVYEVREALLAVPCVACGGSTVCWGYSDVEPEHLPMCDGCCYHTGEDGWCTHVRNDLMALSERLHRDGWKRGDKVLREREPNDVPGDSAARLLAGAG